MKFSTMIRYIVAGVLLIITLTECSNNNNPALNVCEQLADDPSGSYTSLMAPCQITFFYSRSSSLPHTCTPPSASYILETYRLNVSDWPDMCVGNIARCYSVDQELEPFLNYSIHHLGVEIPEGATHLMVNCTEDTQLQVYALLATFGGILIFVGLFVCLVTLGGGVAIVLCIFCCVRDCMRDAARNRGYNNNRSFHVRPTARVVATGRYVAVREMPQVEMHSMEIQ